MKRLLLLAVWFTGLRVCPAASFLPPPAQPIRFTGVHWNDEWDGDSPVEVEGKFSTMAKFETGEVVQLKLQAVGKPARPREWPVLTFLVTPKGAIYRIGATDFSKPPQVEPLDLVVPEIDEAGKFVSPPPSTPEVSVAASERGLRWIVLPWTTEINADAAGLVRFLTSHPSGHFTKYVWQQDLGPTEISMGSGARQDGWSLSRTVEPAGKVAKEDITGLLAALPREFIPVGDALKVTMPADRAALTTAATGTHIEPLDARLEVDRGSGWLSLSSDTDGEGENLEAALWKRPDGSRLLVLLLQQWSSGPTHTRAMRAVEFRKGTFRHVTTSLPLPSDADFYAEDEAAKRPPGGLIEGRWMLPRRGTTITVRPPNEEGAERLPENYTSDESFFFELIWDGSAFGLVQLPRVIPAADLEPAEWAFQSGGAVPGALFLKREGADLKGELAQPGKNRPVLAKIDPAGDAVAFTIGGESAGTARLVDNGGTGMPWNGLSFTKDFLTDKDAAFDAIPRDPEARPLPRYKILGSDGVYYPRFQSTASDWKAINEKVAAIVELERKFYRNAPKTDAEETSFGTRFRITGVCDRTFSLLVSADFYLGGPHGQSVNRTLNWDFQGKRFLKLADVLDAKHFAKLAELINKALAEQDTISEGQTPVSTDGLADIPFTLDPGNEVTFHFAPETLFTGSPEASVTLNWEQLNEASLIFEGSPLYPSHE